MKTLNLSLYGCSFTKNVKIFYFEKFNNTELSNEYIIKNYANDSNSNLKILNSFKENLEPNSTAVIQWSSLTRPNDSNFSIFDISENPLWDLLEEWYGYLDQVKKLAFDNNIKLIQYIGWAQWKDSELNEYHRNKLKSYGITWFKSDAQYELIPGNCFQLQANLWQWSSHDENGLWKWTNIDWGGMAEWVRSNVELYDRYMGYNHFAPTKHFDVHPSQYATIEFARNFLIPTIKKLNENNSI